MNAPLSSADVTQFDDFLRGCLSDPPEGMRATMAEHRDLCERVLAALKQPAEVSQQPTPAKPSLTEADLGFLRSWLKAKDLIVAGLQFLEMADESMADSVRHERECTETAFNLLPVLIDEARFCAPVALDRRPRSS